MSIVTIRDGLCHRVAGIEADPRIVLTDCGLRTALIERRPDPNSAYQREHRRDWATKPCGACR